MGPWVLIYCLAASVSPPLPPGSTNVTNPPPPPGHGCNAPYVPIEPSGVALGWFLTTATLIAPAPQYIALCRSRSSHGVSLLTPTLALTYGVLNLCSAIVVKWPSIQLCGDSSFAPFGSDGCVDQLLDVLQVAASAFCLACILVLVVLYPPHNIAKDRALVFGTLVGLALTIGVTCAVSAVSPCSEASHSLSQTCAVLSALVRLTTEPQTRCHPPCVPL